jgi:CRISPR-associated endoribonuclease Cas6
MQTKTTIKQMHLHLLRHPGEHGFEPVHPYTFRGFLLDIIKDVDPRLAASLHDEQGIKPYAIQYVVKDLEILLTVNLFTTSIHKALYSYFTAIQDATVNIGKAKCSLYRVKMNEINYRDLLEQSTPVDGCKIEFRTPAYFNSSSHDFNIKLPIPGLLFKNLAQMWNEFTGHQVDLDVDGFLDWITKNADVSSFEIKTFPFTLGKGRNISGVKGWIRLRLGRSEVGYNRWVDCLLKLAQYTNVGGNRTAGMGSIKYNPNQPRAERAWDT